MSEIPSFGSNCQRCSQPRKVSVGIMAESLPMRRSGSSKEDEVAKPASALVSTQKGDYTRGFTTTATGQTEPIEQSGFPCIPKGSMQQKSTTSQTFFKAKVFASNLNDSNQQRDLNGVKGASLQHSIQFFSHQSAVLPSENATKQKVDGFVDNGKGEKAQDAAKGENFTSTKAQEIVPDDMTMIVAKAEKSLNGKSEALRLKLWELLGTVSSPVKSKLDLQPLEKDNNLEVPEQNLHQTDGGAAELRRCSDTIETDSESPHCADKRPITRSLTRKRASSIKQHEKLKTIKTAGHNHKPEVKNIFSFEEGWYVGLQGTSNLCTRTFTRRKKTEKNGLTAEPSKVGIQLRNNGCIIQEVAEKNRKLLSGEKSCLPGSVAGLPRSCSDISRSKPDPKSKSLEKHSFKQASRSELDKEQGINTLLLENHEELEGIGHPSLENIEDPQHDLESLKKQKRRWSRIEPQTISTEPKRNAVVLRQEMYKNKNLLPAEKSCSHGSSKGGLHRRHSNINRNSTGQENCFEQPAARKLSWPEDISSPALPENQKHRAAVGDSSLKDVMDQDNAAESPTLGRSPTVSPSHGSLHEETGMKGACNPSSAGKIFSGTSTFTFGNARASFNGSKKPREVEGSPSVRPVPHMEDNDAESSSPSSSADDRDSGAFEEDHVEAEASPETVPIEKPKFMLRKAKRLRSYEDIFQERSPASLSPKGTRESNSMQQELAGQNMEDGLTRAVGMFALALEKLKNKVNLLTSKKSSEILASVAEKIHAQFHNLECQIQTDMSKLTSLNKQKKRRFETEFQEHEKQLKAIHEKFRKEISHLLDGCKGTIEGLEENQIELKGIVEKQKVLHRKLCSQVQEAVDTQLLDAEKRITFINKSAREQMQQLKLAIADCLAGVELS